MTRVFATFFAISTLFFVACSSNNTPAPADMSSPPPADLALACSSYTTAADCTHVARCRWLTPGCATPVTVPSPTGCFERTDCTTTSCGQGTTCNDVVYDPCVCELGEDCCAACAANAKVCF